MRTAITVSGSSADAQEKQDTATGDEGGAETWGRAEEENAERGTEVDERTTCAGYGE